MKRSRWVCAGVAFAGVMLTTLLLTSCSSKTDEGVMSARGETPVKYVVCTAAEQNCFVAARFHAMDSCERHKMWSGMLCNTEPTSGNMICRPDKVPMTFGYCTY